MQTLFPTLRYSDPKSAIDWLVRALGFTVHFIADESGQIVHAQLALGGNLLFIGPDHSDDKYGMHSPLALNGTNQCVCIAVDDGIAARCERARAAGAEIVTEPYHTPYGSHEFSLRDPEGHVWTVGTYRGEANSSSLTAS